MFDAAAKNAAHLAEPPRRLTWLRRDELAAAVLADLAAHGPSVFSEIERRLTHLMGEHLVRRTLLALADEGRVAIETQVRESGIRHGDNVHRLKYKARVFSIVNADGRRK